jgi:hypothetical protein
MLAVTSRFRVLYLTYLSRPSGDRILYRAIRSRRVRTILELGLGNAQRARRMIELAARQVPPAEIRYTGVDLFEARPPAEGPALPLRSAHRMLARCGARVRLCPGDPFAALSRAANSLPRADLVVISPGQDQASLGRAWFFLPRLLHGGSQVFLQAEPAPGQWSGFRPLAAADIDTLAGAATRRRAA